MVIRPPEIAHQNTKMIMFEMISMGQREYHVEPPSLQSYILCIVLPKLLRGDLIEY